MFKEQRMLQAVPSGLSNVFKSSGIVKSFKLMEQKWPELMIKYLACLLFSTAHKLPEVSN